MNFSQAHNDYLDPDKNETGSGDWTLFTKRTHDPKLAWIERQLEEAGIESRRNGRSFHAPILEVREGDIKAAWEILNPVDDVEDDDPRFT